MLRLEMLPAQHGDALLLEYGPGEEPTHRCLIDAGPENAYRAVRERLSELPTDSGGGRELELLVVTHVDGDHIEGVVKVLQDDEVDLQPDDVWFNDWNHLAPLERHKPPKRLGPEAGEFLGALLDQQERPWNAAFDGLVIMVPEDAEAPLPTWTTPGGLRLTVISPTIDTLLRLRHKWKSAIKAAGFTPGNRQAALEQFRNRRWAKAPTLGDEQDRKTLDHSEANGSSIALLAEYGGRRLLLAADAYAPELRVGLERWQASQGQDGPVELDGFKLPHHGSDKNVTPQLFQTVSCSNYLVSTNGKRFHHPDRAALSMVVEEHRGDGPPVLLFNYESPFTKGWRQRDDCEARYGPDAVLELSTS